MARKRARVSKRMLLTWFMLGGFILLFAPQSVTNKFQFAFARTLGWPLGIGRGILLAAAHSSLQSVSDSQAYSNHIANLEKWLQRERSKVEELSRLREQLPLENVKLMYADITPVSGDSQSEFLINRGEKDGVASGQFVLADNSIVGTIYDVSSRSAQVKLITNPQSKIAVEIGQLNLRRVMQGKGNLAKIENVSTKHKVKTGSYVYAAPKAGFLDDPIIVGQITRCEEDDRNPLLWDITVEPVCDIEKLYSVSVIILNPEK